MQINLIFDPSVAASAPAGLVQDLEAAAAILDKLLTNPISVNIRVGVDEIGGNALDPEAGGEATTSWTAYSYAQVQAALKAQANSPLASQIVAALPSAAQVGSQIMLSPAQAYALGLATPSANAVDGEVGFSSVETADPSLLTYLHELTHALGRIRNDSLQSLYAYTAPGQLAALQSSNLGVSAYFSIDGGKTDLGDYLPSDPSDWSYPGPSPNVLQNGLSYVAGSTDISLLTSLGFSINPAPTLTGPTQFVEVFPGQSVNFSLPTGTFYSAQPMTYTATLVNGSPLPSWLSFNPATQSFSGTAPSGGGDVAVTVTATNSLGSATDEFTLGPGFTLNPSIGNLIWNKGTTFSLSMHDLLNGPISAQTQYLVELATFPQDLLQPLPAWMHFDQATGMLTGTMPTNGGSYTLQVTATNPDNDIATFNILVYSAAPPLVAHGVTTQVITRGQAFSIHIPAGTFVDAGGTINQSTLYMADSSFSSPVLGTPPSWMSYDPSTMTLSGTAPTSGSGAWQVGLRVTDTNNATVFDYFNLYLGTTPVTVANALASSGTGLIIQDSSQNVTANLSALSTLAQHGAVEAIGFTDTTPVALTLSANQTLQYYSAISTLSGNFTLTSTDASASEAIYFNNIAAVTFYNVTDSAADIFSNINILQAAAASGKLTAITVTDSTVASTTMTAEDFTNDATVLGMIKSAYHVMITDSAANVAAALDSIEAGVAAGTVTAVTLSDGGIPTLTISSAQLAADSAALKLISSAYSLIETAPTSSATIVGASGSLGNTVTFSGDAASYTISAQGDGSSFTVSGNGTTDILSNVQALQFADHTLIVAASPGAGTVTTGNITELYGAVFGRQPDVAGLSYYQQELATNPGLQLTSLAVNFLQSPEYLNNAAHNYAQTAAGDIQFVNDLYQNLLHRAPAAGDASWYEANVIAPILGSATPNTSAYASALLQAHAAVVTDFSQSAEFLNDVQITAQHPASTQHWLVLI